MCVRHQPESGFFSFQTKDNWFAEKYFPRILRVLNFPPEGPTRAEMENFAGSLDDDKVSSHNNSAVPELRAKITRKQAKA